MMLPNDCAALVGLVVCERSEYVEQIEVTYQHNQFDATRG